MTNIRNKDLQRMKQLMGKISINENQSISSVELKKKSPNGKVYGIVRENKKYFIKESNDGVNFDFIGGLGNKPKYQYPSYEEAVRELNFMFEDFNKSFGVETGTDILTPDLIEEKRFVLKSKKKSEPSNDSFDFGGTNKSSSEDIDFNFDEKEEGGDKTGGIDFGDTGEDKTGGMDFGDVGGEEELDFNVGDDENLEDEDDPIKSIQKMTGKLGQKIRDTEDLSSDTMKWVAKSIISALDLESMDSEDKKDIIRAVKKKEDEGSDEEIDFMGDDDSTDILTANDLYGTDDVDYMDDDCPGCQGSGYNDEMENCVDCGGTGVVDDTIVDWNNLSDEEKGTIVTTSYGNGDDSFPGDKETPMMDWDRDIDNQEDEIEVDETIESEPYRRTGESQYMLFNPEEVDVDYMGDEDDEYCPECHGSGLTDDLEPCLDCKEDEIYRREGEDQLMLFPPSEIDNNELENVHDDRYHPWDHMTDNMTDWMREDNPNIGGDEDIDGQLLFDEELPYDEYESETSGYPGFEEDWMSDGDTDYMWDNEPNINMGELEDYEGEDEDMNDETYPYHEVSDMNFEGIPSQMDYMNDRDEDLYGPGTDGGIEDVDYMEDYMSKFAKDVKRGTKSGGRNLEMHELHTHLTKIKNKLGGSVEIDGDSVVGPFGYVKVTKHGYELHKEGERFPKKFNFAELGKLQKEVGDVDYMDDIYDMPKTAPSKPGTTPAPTTKPGKPDTDRPSPSKRPFTPPPYITPGEEPAPKAEEDYMDYMDDDYGVDEGMDYMDYMEDNDGTCPACGGTGHERKIGFGSRQNTCITCAGTGKIDVNIDNEEDGGEEFNRPHIPSDYTTNTTSTDRITPNYHYREKFNFPINGIDYMSDNDDNLPLYRKRINPMSPKTAPTKPDVKPTTKPGTDKPSPSKRPFTPPPHITPGEEPAPKAKRNNRY